MAAARYWAPIFFPAINNGAKAAGKPIPVGGGVPLTGWAAADGIEFKRGLEMACEEINVVGGILGRPLEPHFEDTKEQGAANILPADAAANRPLQCPRYH